MAVKPDHGVRTRAGQLLSYYMREIAKEKTEFVDDGDGGLRMATKAEKLARNTWRDALGYEEKVSDVDGKEIKIIHQPNRAAASMLFDRIEGRAPMSVSEGDEKLTAAKKVTEQGKKRIGKAGNINADS